MDLNEYQELALRTCSGESAKDPLMTAVLGLSGESGEIADHMKKHLFHGHDLSEDKILDELGDIMWYVAIGAKAINKTLDDVGAFNVSKLKLRYPEGFSVERSHHK